MYTDVNLQNYKYYPPTKSCYLDGRYFNKVFEKYPGLISKPLNISVVVNPDNKIEYTNHMKQGIINDQYPGLLRVIINAKGSRHSNLLILDYSHKKIYRYDPNGTSSPYYHHINQIIKNYLGMYFDFDIIDINEPVSDPGNQICREQGIKNGFCVAYVIKFAHDWLNQKKYDPSDILQFAGTVEYLYGPLSKEKVDIEYGLFGSSDNGPNKQGALVGAGVGALAGGLLIGGGAGVMGGLLAGGLIGSAM